MYTRSIYIYTHAALCSQVSVAHELFATRSKAPLFVHPTRPERQNFMQRICGQTHATKILRRQQNVAKPSYKLISEFLRAQRCHKAHASWRHV